VNPAAAVPAGRFRRLPELFVAALFVIIGAGRCSPAGLSMALGAFIAGLLLSETEFRK
jgi:CPA2 family monovalent cation:H+ antiporter-2